jgi:hypothetical protein
MNSRRKAQIVPRPSSSAPQVKILQYIFAFAACEESPAFSARNVAMHSLGPGLRLYYLVKCFAVGAVSVLGIDHSTMLRNTDPRDLCFRCNVDNDDRQNDAPHQGTLDARRPARRNALVLARRTASGAGTTRYLDDKSQ